MLSCSNQCTTASTFFQSAATTSFPETRHPCLLWLNQKTLWCTLVLASPSRVSLGYVYQSFTVRFLSTQAAHVPGLPCPSLLIGSDGDSVFHARPISLSLEDAFSKVLTLVPPLQDACGLSRAPPSGKVLGPSVCAGQLAMLGWSLYHHSAWQRGSRPCLDSPCAIHLHHDCRTPPPGGTTHLP